MQKKKLIAWLVAAVLLVAVAVGFVFALKSETEASEITSGEAEVLINEQLDKMAIAKTMQHLARENTVKVNSIVSYGNEKDVVLDCTVEAIDIHSAIASQYDTFLSSDEKKPGSTMFKSALNFKMEFEPLLDTLLVEAEKKTTSLQITLFETRDGFLVYADDALVNAAFGGLLDIEKDLNAKNSVVITKPDGSTEEKVFSAGNIKKGLLQCLEINRPKKPDTSTPLGSFWNSLSEDFERNFIEADRWKTIFTGLWTTIRLTLFALFLGILIGFLVAFVRSTYLKTTRHNIILKILNAISQVYLTVIRGTPVVVQIMIIYFVIFMPLGIDKFLAAVICFGLNSGAYVAEIVRGGIMSIDNGQTEAGRSLGFGYMQTMFYIVFPQAFKAVLPALANEFVVLLKETSIAFYIGLGDLMYAGNAIRAATYSAFMPLIAVAIIYLVMVLALQHLVTLLERRLRNSER